jgi:phasin family protein
MLLFDQQTSPSAKAYMESQFTFLSEMSTQMLGAIQKVNDLNIRIAQASLQDALVSAREVYCAQGPYEALSIAAGQVQPAAEKLRAYRQHLTDIAARTQADLAKTAEVHIPETSRTATAVADELARATAEKAQKAAQRQKETIEKMASPIAKPDGKGVDAAAR